MWFHPTLLFSNDLLYPLAYFSSLLCVVDITFLLCATLLRHKFPIFRLSIRDFVFIAVRLYLHYLDVDFFFNLRLFMYGNTPEAESVVERTLCMWMVRLATVGLAFGHVGAKMDILGIFFPDVFERVEGDSEAVTSKLFYFQSPILKKVWIVYLGGAQLVHLAFMWVSLVGVVYQPWGLDLI